MTIGLLAKKPIASHLFLLLVADASTGIYKVAVGVMNTARIFENCLASLMSLARRSDLSAACRDVCEWLDKKNGQAVDVDNLAEEVIKEWIRCCYRGWLSKGCLNPVRLPAEPPHRVHHA